jgi:transcriptional regulator with XRE-family HTH domain
MSTEKKEPVQKAVIALRQHLGMTQQQFAEGLDVTVVTVCRWETSRPPTGFSLFRLLFLAREHKLTEIAAALAKSVDEGLKRNLIRHLREAEAFLKAREATRRDLRQFAVPRAASRTAETALSQLYATKDHPLIGSAYLKILRVIEEALSIAERVFFDNTVASQMFALTHEDLKQELEDEEKRSKT